MSETVVKAETAPRVLAVWTRELDSNEQVGRLLILRSIQKAVRSLPQHRELNHRSIFDIYGKKKGLPHFLKALVSAPLRGRILPLQCGLFSTQQETLNRIGTVTEDVIILDGIRNLQLLKALRQRYPEKYIIVDMDDLMSRRMRLMLDNGFQASLGFFAGSMPAIFNRIVSSKFLSDLILRYELIALRQAERFTMRHADRIVMVSTHEAELLRKAIPDARATVTAIAPPAVIPQNFSPFDPQGRPIRFAFIGSDKIVQNATSIDTLIDLWRRLQPQGELVIFGKQIRDYSHVPANVRLHGFVKSISEVYDGRTVLFTPSLLGGGVKTKFLEAFAYGAPVIGTETTFEGVDPAACFLTVEKLGGEAALKDVQSLEGRLKAAAREGHEMVRDRYSLDHFIRQWQGEIRRNA